jgi:hypothetical protein
MHRIWWRRGFTIFAATNGLMRDSAEIGIQALPVCSGLLGVSLLRYYPVWSDSVAGNAASAY